jgi:molybdenum cofactor cytidylyltransferase
LKFGRIPVAEARGAILAHGVRHKDGLFKKGRLLTDEDVAALQDDGHSHIIAARLDADDVPEDTVAHQITLAACGAGGLPQQAFTGRANLHSSVHGLVVVDELRLRALNHLHESLTIATLANYSVVDRKQMLATIKVIPFAVPRSILDKALAIIGHEPIIRVAAFQPKKAGLIITRLPQTKTSIIAKSETAIQERLAKLGATLSKVIVCDHTQKAVHAAMKELGSLDPVLVFGASAIVDRADVIPAAVVEAGGNVVHLGMPVDPGNLLMLGELYQSVVIGVPSCARSPKVNGFDWVLERVIAGLNVSANDLMDMGVGGLLAEIPSRPQPRDAAVHSAPRVAAILLAAGQSARMGRNKMLVDFNGRAMVRSTAEAILQSSVDQLLVVTGNQSSDVEAALTGLKLETVHNPYFADGLSTSIRCGLEAVSGSADAVIICLGDMPLIEPQLIDRLIAAFNPTEHRTIIVPTYKGQSGNPVLWGKEHFMKLMALEGDRGARALIEKFKSEAVDIESGSDSILRDADTPEALAALKTSV